MGELYAQTLDRADYIKGRNYNLIETWECEYELRLKEDADMIAYIDGLNIAEKLDPRDAFFGGRTNAAKQYYAPGMS